MKKVVHLVLQQLFCRYVRVVNGPTNSGPNRPESENINPNPKTNLKSKSCPKKRESLNGLKNLAMLPGYFDYILVHRKTKQYALDRT